MAGRRNWTWEETVLAMALYMRVPFGSIVQSNPQVRALAKLLGRTPGAVGMKMCNLARFDEKLQARHVSGLAHGGKMDERVWREFIGDLPKLAEAERTVMAQYFHQHAKPQEVREVQEDFFREMVLGQYHHTCCMSGLQIAELVTVNRLKASGTAEELMDPANGICLNMLYSRAFDAGLLTIDSGYRIVVSEHLSQRPRLNEDTRSWLRAADGREILLPERSLPGRRYIEYHNDTVFQHA
ncbi:MAG: hypothetical protein PUB57_08245 [Selenomonadaceae bacterium]|nr:hypothetical protein [Selenomonadaceae bacterium]